MTENIVEVKPEANVYTVLMIITIIVLLVAIAIVGMKLTGSMPNGYGMSIGDMFSPITK
ncbi:MAG TPA: hypothetical protein PKK48_03575 [Phycisphaerae bacterium]|nr:hypothetical protein [Phycisphaerae bacterium]HPS52874.1 hypothetical protein [Phycisphaerae bacterium]